jgi:hypothetical protein
MSPGRASVAQAREETDRLQRSGPFDASVDTKSAVSENQPDADLRDTVQVPLLEVGCIVASIRREGLPDGWLKGARA